MTLSHIQPGLGMTSTLTPFLAFAFVAAGIYTIERSFAGAGLFDFGVLAAVGVAYISAILMLTPDAAPDASTSAKTGRTRD